MTNLHISVLAATNDKVGDLSVIRTEEFLTMFGENSGLLFTALLVGILIGIVGTLLVIRMRNKEKKS